MGRFMRILLDILGNAVALVVAFAVTLGAFGVLGLLGKFEDRFYAAWLLFGVAVIAALVLLIRPPKRWAITMRVAAVGLLLGSMFGCTGSMYTIEPAPGFGDGQFRKP